MNLPQTSTLRLSSISTTPSRNSSGLSNVKTSAAAELTNGITTPMTSTVIAAKRRQDATTNPAPSVVHNLLASLTPMLIPPMVVAQPSLKVQVMHILMDSTPIHSHKAQSAFHAMNAVIPSPTVNPVLCLKVQVTMAVVQLTSVPSMLVSVVAVIMLSTHSTLVETQLLRLSSNLTDMIDSKNVLVHTSTLSNLINITPTSHPQVLTSTHSPSNPKNINHQAHATSPELTTLAYKCNLHLRPSRVPVLRFACMLPTIMSSES